MCTPERLPSLLEAVRAAPDSRTSHLVTHAWPMLLGVVACARIVRVQPLARGQANFPHATQPLLVERYTRTQVGDAPEVDTHAAGVVRVEAQLRQRGRDQEGCSGRHGTSM